jgi:hypothetical protein
VEKHVNSIFSKLLRTDRQAQHPRVQAVLAYLSHADKTDFPAAASTTLVVSAASAFRPRCYTGRSRGRGHRAVGAGRFESS